MSHTPITPDDPRLTAYVLGELEAGDRAAVEQQLAADPEIRRAVDALQEMTGSVFEALQSEPVPELSEEQRRAIRDSAQRPAVTIIPQSGRSSKRRGLMAVLTATIVCATLLLCVSLVDFANDPMAATDRFDADAPTLALADTRMFGSHADELTTWMRDGGVEFMRREAETLDFMVAEQLEGAESASGITERLVEQRLGEYEKGFAATSGKRVVPGDPGEVTDLSVVRESGRAKQSDGFGMTPTTAGRGGVTRSLSASEAAPAGESGQGRLGGAVVRTGRANDKAGIAPLAPIGAVDATHRGVQNQPPMEQLRQRSGAAGLTPEGEQSQSGAAQGIAGGGVKGMRQSGQQNGQADPSRFYYAGQQPASGDGSAPIVEMEESAPHWGATSQPANKPAGAKSLGDAQHSAGESQTAPVAGTTLALPKLVEAKRGTPEQKTEYRRGHRFTLTDGAVPAPGGAEYGAAVAEQPATQVKSRIRMNQPDANGGEHSGIDPQSLSANLGSIDEAAPRVAHESLIISNAVPPQADDLNRALGRAGSDYDGLNELALGWEAQSVPFVVPLFALQTETFAAWHKADLSKENGQWFYKNKLGDLEPAAVPGTEVYAPIVENEFLSPTDAPLSTFGLDVDTASYANVRRFLMEQGRFPPPDAVRIEELVNYFTYSDRQPADDEPLAVNLEAAACPWDTDHRLVRIGLKAKEMDLAERPATTLVFLVDTSGSMRDENKLPLVKQSLRLLAEEMTENDRIAIVTYSSDAGLLLDSTSGEHTDEIIAAIDGLNADGSTNGEAGLKLAYNVATKHFIESGQNRVILCTDGDFNVGTSDTDPLVGMISEKRASGVFLSICGYGTGNIKDEKLERIADKGNGQYHYIDNLKEARKVFLDELTGTLYTVAKDVKLQVEFNPQVVASYRLLGYENRILAAEDFNNDRVDSGDMGAGHSVTALYEIIPIGAEVAKPLDETPGVDPLKYQGSGIGSQESEDRLAATNGSAIDNPSTINHQPSIRMELLTVKLRYKQPRADESVKREFPLVDDAKASPSEDIEWSAAVASFGMLIRGSRYAGQSSLEGVLELAQGAKGRDEFGRRREFIDMVLQTQVLVRRVRGQSSPEPQELSSVDARRKATVGGKYQDLLDKLEMRSDASRYGAFHDYGWSADKAYAGREGLPAGYWVYVFPDWYIWGETVSADAE